MENVIVIVNNSDYYYFMDNRERNTERWKNIKVNTYANRRYDITFSHQSDLSAEEIKNKAKDSKSWFLFLVILFLVAMSTPFIVYYLFG